ncbi:hypothetical protein ABZ345_42495 [Lentzea sp. NPDC005914]|uniref:hypothetical protein n=1 Tax=Lentzea sp. NPDC005914 TaxID=3154572 RepID=UPI0033FE8E21
MPGWWRKRFWPEETVSSELSVGGRAFTVVSETKIVGLESAAGDDVRARTETTLSLGTVIGPCPPLRVAPRQENRLNDDNAGAVATGVPQFDDRFLVFCDDLAFVRRMTPVLVSAPPTDSTEALELGGGRAVLHRKGAGTETIAANYLNALIPLLPPELRR